MIEFLAAPALVFVQAACAERDFVADRLRSRHGEQRISAGLRGPVVYEVWHNPETGSWSIVMTTPDGISCLMAAGQGWQTLIDETPKGDPT